MTHHHRVVSAFLHPDYRYAYCKGANHRLLASSHSGLRGNVHGSPSSKRRAKRSLKRVVEPKASPRVINQTGLHLYISVQRPDPPPSWLIGAPRATVAPLGMMHSVVHYQSKARGTLAREFRSGIVILTYPRCRASCSPMQNGRPIPPPLRADCEQAFPMAKRSQRRGKICCSDFISLRHATCRRILLIP